MEVLERRLGLKAVIAISISSMLGPGIFVLPGVVAADAGSGLWISYLLATICIIPAALSKAELATAMPTSGGTYVYIERTFGPLIGTVAGLGIWLSLLFKTSFALIGIGAYLKVFADVPIEETAIILLIVIFILNVNGVGKLSGILMTIVTVCIGSLSGISFWSLTLPDFGALHSYASKGVPGIVVATATIFVAYAGIIKIAAIAEEIIDPNSNLPKGMIYSLLIVSALYVIVSLGYIKILPTLNGGVDLSPIYSLALTVGGKTIGMVFSGIAIFTMASMANAGVLAASRFPFAMSRDHLLPSFLGKLSKKSLTPINAILISCLIVAGVIYGLNVEKVAKFASVFMIIMFVAVNFTVIVLRETRVQWYNPGFKSKFYPTIPVFGILSGITLIISISQYFIWAVLSIAIPGLLIYFFYSRKRVTRKGVVGFRGTRKDLVNEEPSFIRNVEFPVSSIAPDRQANVVVSLYGKERSPDTLIELGIAIADHGEVEVAHLTEVPEQTSVHDIEDSSAVKSLARRIRTMARKNEVTIYFDPVTSHDIFASVHEISKRLHCTWLIREWGGWSSGAFTQHNQMGWLVEHLECHLVTFRDAGIRYFRKILVYVKRDHISKLPIDLASHLAGIHDASVTIVSFVSEDAGAEDIEVTRSVLSSAVKPITVPTSISVIKAKEEIEAITALTVEYDMMIFLDEGEETKLRRILGNTINNKIIANAACSVVALKEGNLIGVSD